MNLSNKMFKECCTSVEKESGIGECTDIKEMPHTEEHLLDINMVRFFSHYGIVFDNHITRFETIGTVYMSPFSCKTISFLEVIGQDGMHPSETNAIFAK